MTAKVTFDIAAFSTALQNFANKSSRSLPEIVNNTAGTVALRAYRLTPKAFMKAKDGGSGIDRAKARDVLLVKAGFRAGRKYKTKTNLVQNWAPGKIIWGKVRNQSGIKGNRNPELKKLAYEMGSKRFYGLGFLSSGWLPAAKELLGKKWRRKRPLRGAVPTGQGTRAQMGNDSCFAVLDNLIGRATSVPGVSLALQTALAEEQASMEKETKRRIQQDLLKAGVKV